MHIATSCHCMLHLVHLNVLTIELEVVIMENHLRAGSRRMVEALLLRKPANHHLLYRSERNQEYKT